jgi:RNA-directed DNA polymerase
MERHGNLFEDIASVGNLLAAERAAFHGKRRRPAPVGFRYDLEPNFFELHDELQSGTYQLGAYRAFGIHDPKKRLISAAPYRNRVVHHAVSRVAEPIFDRSFISDSCANRIGKGTHKVLDRATEFCHRWGLRSRLLQGMVFTRLLRPIGTTTEGISDVEDLILIGATHGKI